MPRRREVLLPGLQLGTIAADDAGNCLPRFGDSSVGMFSRFPVGYGLPEISDGLSNTFMAGETVPSHSARTTARSA